VLAQVTAENVYLRDVVGDCQICGLMMV